MVYYWNVHAFDDITQLSVYSYKHPSLSFPSMLYFFSRRRKSASNARKLLEKGKKRPQVCVNEGTIDRCKPREISCLTTTHYYNSEWQKGYSSQAQDCDFRSVHRERMRCSVARLTHCPHHYTKPTCEAWAPTLTVRRAMPRQRWITWLTRKNPRVGGILSYMYFQLYQY